MLTKIYLLININNINFARFSHVGTWETFREPCVNCQRTTEKLSEPLLIEWEPGSDLIGDFSWCGYSIVVLDNVKNFMIKKEFECEFGKVEVVKNSTTKRKTKMVQYPYEGPNLNWLLAKSKINLDVDKSKLELKNDCVVCNLREYKFKMDNIVIPRVNWNNEKMFKISQFNNSAATYVTRQALEELLSEGFTNFKYKEAGYIE
ncbi:hypothetical protein P8V03_09830 [Clostridium sp. A1-XYC3]|uniref:Uncharacterized protein n=1 Tax=Clostridium tanneri TaxID=3037988 RepID=A0ABU4JTJ1_9CLOT|nr:hypothetical protein [Clostridium sp. A1-XYC3]MDW8801453.1 hypothetical protein [Clostridium sp. A1-XYC3]